MPPIFAADPDATAIGLGWLAVILGTLVYHGASGLSLDVFTHNTPPPATKGGGLLNAIMGSLFMTVIAVLIGTPVGILAGTFMAEYGRFSKITHVVRFINDILLSAPSIVVGLFIYDIMVAPMHGFSGMAGAVALAVLVIPVVVRTTEDMLALVPRELREAASALGMPLAYVIGKVSYRAARAGIVTASMLAVARAAGETAPLLFTALGNRFWSTSLVRPIASLPVMVFDYARAPYDDWNRQAWTGALVLVMIVTVISALLRITVRRVASR